MRPSGLIPTRGGGFNPVRASCFVSAGGSRAIPTRGRISIPSRRWIIIMPGRRSSSFWGIVVVYFFRYRMYLFIACVVANGKVGSGNSSFNLDVLEMGTLFEKGA